MGYISYEHTLTRWLYIIRWSCLKTLAQKHHTNVRGVERIYPNFTAKVQVTVKGKIFTKEIKLLTETEVKNKALEQDSFNEIMQVQESIRRGNFVSFNTPFSKEKSIGRTPRIFDDHFIEKMTVSRTAANLDLPCLICGFEHSEMHDVRHVRKSNWSKISKDNFLDQLQYIRNRKQVPVCRSCHMNIHSGTYQGKKLSKLMDNKIIDSRICAIEGYIIKTEPYKGLPLIESLLQKGLKETE